MSASIRDAVERLNRIAGAARAGVALGADGEWLADVLDAFLAGADFEQAAGLASRGTTWRSLVPIPHRDELIRKMRAQHFASFEPGLASRLIAKVLQDYAGNNWARECAYASPPQHSIGTPNEIAYWVFQLKPRALGHRQVERVLAARTSPDGQSNVVPHLACSSAKRNEPEAA